MNIGKELKRFVVIPNFEPIPPRKVPEREPERVTEPDREKVKK